MNFKETKFRLNIVKSHLDKLLLDGSLQIEGFINVHTASNRVNEAITQIKKDSK